MRLLGIILIALATLALIYQGYTYVTREVIVEAGPVTITADRQHTVWIPPLASAIALAAGVAMFMSGSRKTA